MPHKCNLIGCDGTKLGHSLAKDFPEETARVDRELARLAEPKEGLRVNPANLQVDEPDTFGECQYETPDGLCGELLVKDESFGEEACPKWRKHL